MLVVLKKNRNAGGLKALDDLLCVRSTCSQGAKGCVDVNSPLGFLWLKNGVWEE